ncbi:hypothetical protein [Azospirillum picis]|uniref:DUF1127 domain-containing protein n=1 Tax=Azospirillum picis TaxID=488438 RepID=A0ABU0MJE9_9PROT|nr:hypothetical protein [Azospirillum picis]MBP2299796.1 hypothetical protein [Azospirillum picis]MDQ0533592.1 hypothetical protein [Azospirillum picis]
MPLPSHPPCETAARLLAGKGWCATLLERWRAGRQARALDSLTAFDRNAVLHDAGLAESDLPAVAHGGHARSLLPAALALRGIDGAALDGGRADIMHDLARVCMHCRKARACTRLLAAGDRGGHARLCPNEPTLASLG